MLTGDVQCLETNPASSCVLTIIEDVSGDAQGRVPILLSLLHATQALNQILWSGVPFLLTAGPLWSSLEQDNPVPHRERVPTVLQLVKHFLGPPDRQISLQSSMSRIPGNVDDLTRQLEQIWQEISQ
ncbi:uncharacterized protein TNCV_2001951 [Trichonephila clavipes]|nr:uncharacterized protein TNCV_2001951 [Trichonephila clavipes]